MMKHLRTSVALVLALVMALGALSGCTNQPASSSASASNSTSTSQSTSTSTSATQTSGITLTDQAGRTVTLEQPATKIVSAYYLSSSLLIALGLQDQVVGIEIKADTREIYKRAAPEFLELPAIGSGKGVNVEEIAALEPELVILPLKLQESAARFDTLNIPCLVIDPETMDGFMETIRLIGEATGAQDRANELIAFHEDMMSEISALCADVETRPTVYMAGTDFLRTSGAGMYQNALIEMAGGTNVAAELSDSDWVDISAEQLLSWNPERIYMVSYAEYTEADLLNDDRFSSLSAMQNGALYTFPSLIEPWDYPTPSSALGIYWLAAQLHPELVSPEEFVTVAEEFYQTFYGISVTDDDLDVRSLFADAA